MSVQELTALALEAEAAGEWTRAGRLYAEALEQNEADAHLLFSLGHAHFHQNNLIDAAGYIERAVVLQPFKAPWRYRLGFIHEKLNEPAAAIAHYRSALKLEPTRTRWEDRLRRLERQAVIDDASVAHNLLTGGPLEAIEKSTDSPDYYSDRLTEVIADKGQKWQELEILRAGLRVHLTDPSWRARLGAASYAMNNPAEAAENFRIASRLQEGNANWYFHEGHSWDQIGRKADATRAYKLAVTYDKTLKADSFGIGVFFQKKGMWREACTHYIEQALLDPSNAGLRFRIGLSYDRCYLWSTASVHYQHAIVLDPKVSYWHYKLGLAYERQARWQEAAAAYVYAHTMDKKNGYWSYRAGYAYESAGQYEEACLAYIESCPVPLPEKGAAKNLSANSIVHLRTAIQESIDTLSRSQSPDAMLRLGHLGVSIEDWQLARQGYEQAAKQVQDYDSILFYWLGFTRFKCGAVREAAEAFRQTRLFKTSDGIDIEKYTKNKLQKLSMEYVEYYETLPIQDNVVLWESNHGSSIGCHPLAVFDEVLSSPDYANFFHIWVIDIPENIPHRLRGLPNVVFARTHSDLYKRYLASAKYLVNNVSFPPYFIRKEGQQYLNTWHGTPLKTLGRDMAGGPVAHANIARNFIQSTHIMSPNRHTSTAIIERHDIEGLFEGKIAITGSPRIDSLIRSDPQKKIELRRLLGISDGDTRPVILYAPTWRGAANDRYVDTTRLAFELDALRNEKYHIFFRAHRLTEGLLAEFEEEHFLVPGDIDTNDLLIAVDVLITDYSSIFFDFLPTGRPIVFYAYDLEDYMKDRGLYLRMEDMPGTLCRELAEVKAAALDSISTSKASDDRYRKAQLDFCPMEDGKSAKRVTRFFFEDDPECLNENALDERTALLFHHGLIPNGIATSFLNLVSSLDPDLYRVFLVVEPHVLAANPSRFAKLQELPAHVQVIGRVGVQSLTPEERWVSSKMNALFHFTADEQWDIYRRSFVREYRRIFGSKVFSAAIEFDGYAAFWSALIAFGGEHTRKSIYLHNEMFNEWKMKFPNLEIIFRLYSYYDSLLSVAESVAIRNRKGLSELFDLAENKFRYSDNQIDPDRVLRLSENALESDIETWFRSTEDNYLAIGRLSPEKDHAKLIRAFVDFRVSDSRSNLIIIGDGPLRNDLQLLIIRLQAESYIWLAGQRPNPYPAIRAATCFVLPSLHEGQPMVLFEAMILERPIICTEMPGPREVLDDRFGLVVENSQHGLLDGLLTAQAKLLPQEKFDFQAYKRNARHQFLSNALKGT